MKTFQKVMVLFMAVDVQTQRGREIMAVAKDLEDATRSSVKASFLANVPNPEDTARDGAWAHSDRLLDAGACPVSVDCFNVEDMFADLQWEMAREQLAAA